MKNLRFILIPFSWLYGIIVRLRNAHYLNTHGNRFHIPIDSIVVGNLNLGGTGKTPFTEFLISKNDSNNTAILSRGYGRKTKGFLEVSRNSSSSEVGDEPLQMIQKAKQSSFYVCEDRSTGIKNILQLKPETDLIILDDAFQHLKVKANFYCLISRLDKPFYSDFILPAGNLREQRAGAKRAQAIIISKCPPQLSIEQKEGIVRKVRKYSKAPIYFTYIRYAALHKVISSKNSPSKVCLLTGIASDQPIIDELNTRGIAISKHFKFRDHHNFTSAEIENIVTYCKKNNAGIITTEKDWMRLLQFKIQIQDVEVQTLPIKIGFLFDGQDQFLSHLSTFTSK